MPKNQKESRFKKFEYVDTESGVTYPAETKLGGAKPWMKPASRSTHLDPDRRERLKAKGKSPAAGSVFN